VKLYANQKSTLFNIKMSDSQTNKNSKLEQAHKTAKHFLSYRPRSEAEIRKKLNQRFPEILVNQVLAILKEKDLINDVQFAKIWKENRDSLNPRSAHAIKKELLDKGIDHEIAKNAVSNINDSEAAYRASKRKSLSLNKNDFSSFEQKLLGYLHRRGFDELVSTQTVNTLWKETRNTNEILQETY